MDGEQLGEFVLAQLEGYHYDPPPGLKGNPFSPHKVRQYLARMRQALIPPYRQRFELRETYEQVGQLSPAIAEYWVVAKGKSGYLEWYDPQTGDFGLGISTGDGLPVSIGVRGDAVGVFMAM
jgi:hypothetical protein